MSIFSHKPAIDLEEVARYVKDLEHITILRDKALNQNFLKEGVRYDTIIECMQLVLIELNKR